MSTTLHAVVAFPPRQGQRQTRPGHRPGDDVSVHFALSGQNTSVRNRENGINRGN